MDSRQTPNNPPSACLSPCHNFPTQVPPSHPVHVHLHMDYHPWTTSRPRCVLGYNAPNVDSRMDDRTVDGSRRAGKLHIPQRAGRPCRHVGVVLWHSRIDLLRYVERVRDDFGKVAVVGHHEPGRWGLASTVAAAATSGRGGAYSACGSCYRWVVVIITDADVIQLDQFASISSICYPPALERRAHRQIT